MGALFLRDVRLGLRAGGGALVGILFFLAVIAVVPFGVGPDLKLLARIGAAMLWIGALLATLLGLDRLFQADRDDGSLDLLMMQRTAHAGTYDARQMPGALDGQRLAIGHRLAAAWAFHEHGTMRPSVRPRLTLLVGTPAITLIGAVGAAVAVSLPRGGLLVSVIVLPLTIPVLIFGVSASYAAVEDPAPFLPPFLILAAITLFFAVLGPVAAAAALRSSAD